jgi:hypothetical protein
MEVLLGKGNGQFSSPALYGLDGPQAVEQRDLNGDGISDLVVFSVNNTTIDVYLGTLSGEFQAAKSYPVGGIPRQVAFADLNKDGKMDMAVATLSGVAILLGNGNGTFSAAKTFAMSELPDCIAVGDLRGIGILDVIVTSIADPSIYVLNGNGKGSFSKPVRYSGGDSVYAIFTGDFNGDGVIDIAEFDTNHTGPLILYNLR